MGAFGSFWGILGRRGAKTILFLAGASLALFSSGCSGFVTGKSSTGGNPPPLTLSNVSAGTASVTNASISWQSSAPANSQVNYGVSASYGSSTAVDPSMVTTHQEPLSNLKPGTLYHFQVRSTDANNQAAASSDMTFTTAADTTPPSVSITSPSAGATLSATVSVTASASDNVAVASVQFKVDNANTGAAITTSPYTYALNTTNLSDGNHVLTATATDTSGNAATSAGVAVKVNNTTPGPSIASLNPASGLVGSSVTIAGANFGATQGTSTLKFGATTATATSWSATSIVATVPAGASTGNVVVTVGGVASNGVTFTVTTPAPSITSLNPTSGLVGSSVTIAGANFGATKGTSTVKFGATTATATSWSATSIVANVPAGASTGNVVVTVGGVASNGVTFTITTPAPSIASLNPTSGLVGSSVTVAGANFGATQGTSTVKFGATTATATIWSATSIVATVPAGASTGNVVVTVGGVASNGVAFTVTTPAPSITSLNPTSGLVGASVTISGANFGATQGTSTVSFGAMTAAATSWSATSIVANVPAGATTGTVVVTVGGVASNGVTFTITTPAPSITSLNPTSGLVGTPVTIAGANFGATQGTSTVKFGATTATATSWSATSIVANVPAGASTGNVVVTVGGAASNGVSFTVTADTTPPVVIITAPANNATVSGTITLTATATDPDSPVSFVQFQVDGANTGAQLTTAPYSLSLDTATLSNATHSLTAVAQDPSGNVGTSATVTITVSNSSAALPTLIYSTATPLAVPSGGSWTYNGTCTSSAPCYRAPLPEATTAGSTLIMAFSYDSSGSNQVFSVTDNKSNTWVLDATSSASNNKTMRMYRASNVAAGTSYIDIQLTSGSQNGYWNALVGEFFNVGALDGSSCNAASSATINAGSITPAQNGDLIFQAKYSAGLIKQTALFTPGLQPNITWSMASQLLGDGAADQYGVYNSTVPLNPTFTQAASDSYISCAVALKAASAGAAATAIPRVVHQEHDAMPKNAANPWHVGLVVDVPNSAVYLSYVGNDSISSVSSSPAPNVGWTASGVDFNGLNGHNHVNFYCAQWTTPPGTVNLSINRSGSSNDSINMIYVVQNGTCNLDADSGGQANVQNNQVSTLTTCSGCLTPTKPNDFIMANGGQAYCTATSLSSPGGIFDSTWFTGNTIDGPTQTDENNFWMHFYNGNSLSPITVTWNESCDNFQGYWAGRVAAYQSK
jgi:hypothetical protein